MSRILTATITAALVTAAAPATAQWNYDPAMAAATSYCAARDAGKTVRQADDAAATQIALAAGGRFGQSIATVLVGGQSAIERARYIARQMCPQYFDTPMPTFPLPDPAAKPWPYNDL
jgi:hypothetical protein